IVMTWQRGILGVLALGGAFLLGHLSAGRPRSADEARAEASRTAQKERGEAKVKGWGKGKGWGWVWGKDGEGGSLNAMTAATRKAALGLVKEGKVYDLGVPYDRNSFKWPGHSPGEILTFRGPEGVKRQGDFRPVSDPKSNPDSLAWHSCALFINDNVAT